MFNKFDNIYSPRVLGEVDVYEYLDSIENPIQDIKSKIILAREFRDAGNEDAYNHIKVGLPCYTLNFTFNKKKSNDSIKKPTGFIYLDVDAADDININNPLIFAAWKSVSSHGLGILIKVEGLALENFKQTYNSLAEAIGVKADINAAKATQYTIQSYDEEVYLNNDSTTYYAPLISTPISLSYKKKKRRYANEMGVENKIRYDNLDEIDFVGQDYLVFPDEKYQAAKCFVPEKIFAGERNQKLFTIGTQFKALNPNVSPRYLYKKMHGINNRCCTPPLHKREVDQLVSKIVEQDDIEPFYNYPRRVIFNPEAKISTSEKRNIVNNITAERKKRNTTMNMVWAMYYWDYFVFGQISQKKLQKVTGKNIKTIERHYSKAKEILINQCD